MTGIVDEQLRALLQVPVAASRDGRRSDLMAWVDTAFNGGLAIPRRAISALGLVKLATIEATLADGRLVDLELFRCFLDWFGATYETQIVASDALYPLLGTTLLDERRLAIDYAAKTVALE